MNILDELGLRGRDFDHPVWINRSGLPNALLPHTIKQYSKCPRKGARERSYGNFRQAGDRSANVVAGFHC
jgi:hypothetical protein